MIQIRTDSMFQEMFCFLKINSSFLCIYHQSLPLSSCLLSMTILVVLALRLKGLSQCQSTNEDLPCQPLLHLSCHLVPSAVPQESLVLLADMDVHHLRQVHLLLPSHLHCLLFLSSQLLISNQREMFIAGHEGKIMCSRS